MPSGSRSTDYAGSNHQPVLTSSSNRYIYVDGTERERRKQPRASVPPARDFLQKKWPPIIYCSVTRVYSLYVPGRREPDTEPSGVVGGCGNPSGL